MKKIYNWYKDESEAEMWLEIYCEDCGNTFITDNTEKLCPVCENKTICEHCGTLLSAETEFCSECNTEQ